LGRCSDRHSAPARGVLGASAAVRAAWQATHRAADRLGIHGGSMVIAIGTTGERL